jgi:HPt (histidine-containing phosphotransfer) domain-containing protein
MDDFVSKPVDFAELEALLPGIATGRRAKADALLASSEIEENAALLDAKQTLVHLGGDEELLKELYGLLCEEATERMVLAQRCVETSDYEGLRRISHKVRGSAASICAGRLSTAAADLELAAAARDAEAIARGLEPFLSIYKATVKEAAAYGTDKVDNRIPGS